jgi:uncharacterized protein YkwD
MKIMKNVLLIAVIALMIVISADAATVFAAAENRHTITMGDNTPMIRDEFMEWREQRGIHHFNIEGSILPACVFFDGYIGRSFGYGELRDRILHVYLIPGMVSPMRIPSGHDTLVVETPNNQAPSLISPVLFTDLAPILFSDAELSAMIERVPKVGPLDARSAITLPNRRLSESELAAWIAEYNDMGGATAFELAVIQEINRAREHYGLHPLALNPALMLSSRLKAQEFGDLQYYSHRSPVHGSPSAAAQMFGFEGAVWESMTRAGRSGAPMLRSTPEGIVAGMLASNRGHREALLHPNIQSVGFGAFFSPNSRGANGDMSHMFYFVTQFEFVHE